MAWPVSEVHVVAEECPVEVVAAEEATAARTGATKAMEVMEATAKDTVAAMMDMAVAMTTMVAVMVATVATTTLTMETTVNTRPGIKS